MEVGEFDFGQLSLNLPHCAALQTSIEPRYPWTRFNTRAVRFVLSSLYTAVIPENWYPDTTDTHPLLAKWPRDATSKPRPAWLSLTSCHRLNCSVDFNEICVGVLYEKLSNKTEFQKSLSNIVYIWAWLDSCLLYVLLDRYECSSVQTTTTWCLSAVASSEKVSIWKLYFAEGNTGNFALMFCTFRSICIKFGKGYFDKFAWTPVSGEVPHCSSLRTFPHLMSDVYEIWCNRFAHDAVNSCEFHEDWRRESPAVLTEWSSVLLCRGSVWSHDCEECLFSLSTALWRTPIIKW